MGLKKVIAALKRHKNFLITTHTNPEGDALGSELAIYRLVKSMGKHAIIINEGATPYGYDFLPGINKIKPFSQRLEDIKFDAVIIVDCSEIKRCGQVVKLNLSAKTIINIDHHISNTKFGEVNWIEPYASSCAEMIYKLYKKLHLTLNRDSAMPLYVGILTDTGSFHYANTTNFTHKAVSELLKYNLNVAGIYQSLYENIPFEDMKLLIRILPTIRLKAKGRIVYFQILRHLLREKKISFDLTENVLNFGRVIKGVEVVVLCKENLGKDEVRVNLRSQSPKVDVNKIARFFGGGGHKAASGCTIKGRIEVVRKKVLAKVSESLK